MLCTLRALAAGFAVLGCLVWTSRVAGDSWASPTPRVFASKWGQHGFKLLDPHFLRTANGVLFRLNKQGEEEIIWQRELVNVPHRVYVANQRDIVVTVDTYGQLGGDHSVVVYGEKGELLADYKLDQLLSEVEIILAVTQSVSSQHWAQRADFSFSPREKEFVIRFQWPEDFLEKVAMFRKELDKIQDPQIRAKMRQVLDRFEKTEAQTEEGTRVLKIDLQSGKLLETGKSGAGPED